MTETTDRDGGYELRHYLDVLWRRKLSIVTPIVVLTLAGWLLGSALSVSHTSSAEILAKPLQTSVSTGGSTRVDTILGDEIAIMSSDEIREPVEAAAGHEVAVTIAQEDTESNVVTITVEGEADQVQQDAQSYAETYVEIRRAELSAGTITTTEQLTARLTDLDAQIAAFTPQIADLDTQIAATTDPLTLRNLSSEREDLLAQRGALNLSRADAQQRLDDVQLSAAVNASFGIDLLSSASEPEVVEGATAVQYASAGLAIGLVLGVLLAFAREHFDTAVRTVRQVELASGGARLLGVVPSRHRGEAL